MGRDAGGAVAGERLSAGMREKPAIWSDYLRRVREGLREQPLEEGFLEVGTSVRAKFGQLGD